MTHPNARVKRPAEPNEVAMSLALMGVAATIAATTGFGVGAFFDKILPSALLGGLILGAAAILSLLLSIYFGGRGIAYGTTLGPGSPFNLQSWCGVVGFFCMLAAVFVLALNQKPDEVARQSARIKQLEAQVLVMRGEISRIQTQNKPCRLSLPGGAAASQRGGAPTLGSVAD